MDTGGRVTHGASRGAERLHSAIYATILETQPIGKNQPIEIRIRDYKKYRDFENY
jgi:hypothetical protein